MSSIRKLERYTAALESWKRKRNKWESMKQYKPNQKPLEKCPEPHEFEILADDKYAVQIYKRVIGIKLPERKRK